VINIIINKIEILNFGPFYGKHEISFENNGSGIHLIRGGTGQGKTSIQRAILWGIYGEVKDRRGERIRPTSLLNRTACSEDLYKFAVQIDFIHDGLNCKLFRCAKAKVHKDKKYEDGMVLEVYVNGRVVPGKPEHHIQRMLPSEVSRFYFFDGEMLRDYEELLEEDSRAMTLLRDSIERLLGIPYLKIARSDLEAIRKKFEKERARIMRDLGGSGYEELAEIQQKLQDDLDEIDNSISILEEQKDKLGNRIAEDKRKLTDMKEVQEIARKRLEIEKDIKINEGEKGKQIIQRSAMVENLYKNVLAPIATTLINKFEIQSQKALDMYNQKRIALDHKDKLKKGIEKSQCSYCGTVLDEKKLRDLKVELEETEIKIKRLTQIPEPNLEYEHSKNALNKMMENALSSEDLKELDDGISKYDYEIARLTSELENVMSKLGDVDTEEPMKLELKIRANSEELGRLAEKIESKKERKIEILEEKSDLDRKIDAIPQDQLQKLNKRIAITESIRSIFEKTISTFREEQKALVEETATEIFRSIRSKEEFVRLRINNQYGLSIITANNTVLDRSEWRSSGEEQLVALSLIGALNKCAHVKAPIFMDTPFGRLDMAHGERVLKYIPKMSDQLVLLVTDREFREGDEIHLAGNIKTDLSLRHKGEKEGSVIYPTTD